MAKRKVGWPKQLNNNTGAQSGVNLTGMTVSSQSHELETSSVSDRDATTTPPPMRGGSQTGAQESPSMSDIELEYDIIPPDKGKGKAVPNNTVQGGSGHDPPREWERMSHLLRQRKWWSLAITLNKSPSDKKIGWWRHLGWTSIWGKKGSGNLSQSTEENAGLPVKPRSTHKCVEKEVLGMSRDQLFVRQPVTDRSYKKWWVGAKPPKRLTSYERRTWTRWAAMLPI